MDGLLAITPAQFPLESPCGYILRLTEENIYPSPYAIATLSGHDGVRLRTHLVDIEIISRILGRSRTELHGYLHPETGALMLCGHHMPLHSFNLNQRICAACIDERGYRPAWMDLAFVDACPRHSLPLQVGCRACNRRLSFSRPGLLTCQCGSDLRKTAIGPSSELTDAHRTLLDAFIREFEGERGALPAATFGGAYNALSFADWMSIIQVLGKLQRKISSPALGADISYLRRASVLLHDWPNRISDCIWHLLPEARIGGGVAAIFSHNRQIATDWGKDLGAAAFGALSKAMDAIPLPRRASTLEFELVPWQEPPLERAKQVRNYRRERQANTVRDSLRTTAAAAGIPVQVLRFLRAENLFVHTNTYRTNAVCMEDVTRFHRSLLEVSLPATKGQFATLVPALKAIRNGKFFGAEGKAKFLKAVLLKEIKLFRGISSAAEDLCVRHTDINEFVAQIRAARFDGGLTISEAAKSLGTCSSTIRGLIKAGVLSTVSSSVWHRVKPASLADFGAKYVSVSSLTRKFGLVGGRTALTYLQDAEITPIRWKGYKEGLEGSFFIRRADLPLTLSVIEERLRGQKFAKAANTFFRDPRNLENVWGGRGRRPQWLRDYLSAGHEIGDFLVEC